MQQTSYPALFRCADDSSNKVQSLYIRLIVIEYSLLVLAAAFSVAANVGRAYYICFALVFVLSISVLLTRAFLKPVQDWYRSRALAESVKTISWRYMMRAEPFNDSARQDSPALELVKHLQEIFSLNKEVVGKISIDWSHDEQITPEMERVRNLDMQGRMEFYRKHRIEEQGRWYSSKAAYNKRQARKWVLIGVAAYVLAGALVLVRLQSPSLQHLPIEPVIVFASSIIGWVQIKKFGELAAAYGITAQEIGLIKPKLMHVSSEQAFSDFVNETELAFSREHTFWLARQTS